MESIKHLFLCSEALKTKKLFPFLSRDQINGRTLKKWNNVKNGINRVNQANLWNEQSKLKNYSKQVVTPKFFKSKHGFIGTPKKKKYDFKVYDLSEEESFYNSGSLFHIHKRTHSKLNKTVENYMNMNIIQGEKRDNLSCKNVDETLFSERNVYSSRKNYFSNLAVKRISHKTKVKLDQTHHISPVCYKSKYQLPKKSNKICEEICNEDMLITKKPMNERFKTAQFNACSDFTYEDFDDIIRCSNKSTDTRSPRNKRLHQTSQLQSSFSIVGEKHHFEQHVPRSGRLCTNQEIISHEVEDAMVPVTPKRKLNKKKAVYGAESLESFSRENIDGKGFYESHSENEGEKFAPIDQEGNIDEPTDPVISLPEDKILTVYENLLSKEELGSAWLDKNKSFGNPQEIEMPGALNKCHAYDNKNDNIQIPNIHDTSKNDKFASDDCLTQAAAIEMDVSIECHDSVEILEVPQGYNSQKTSKELYIYSDGKTNKTDNIILLKESNVGLLSESVCTSQATITMENTCLSTKDVGVENDNNFENLTIDSVCQENKTGNNRNQKRKKRKTCYGKRKKARVHKGAYQLQMDKIHPEVESPVNKNEEVVKMDSLKSASIEGSPQNLKLAQNISMDIGQEIESIEIGTNKLITDINVLPQVNENDHQLQVDCEIVVSSELQEQQENQEIIIFKDILGPDSNEICNVDLNLVGSKALNKQMKSKVTKRKKKQLKISEVKVRDDGVVEIEIVENSEVNFTSTDPLVMADIMRDRNELGIPNLGELDGFKFTDCNMDMQNNAIPTNQKLIDDDSLDLSKLEFENDESSFECVEMNNKVGKYIKPQRIRNARKSQSKVKFKNNSKKMGNIAKDMNISKAAELCNNVQELQEKKFSEFVDTCNTNPTSISECGQLNISSSTIAKESTSLMVQSNFVESSDFTVKDSKFPGNHQINEQKLLKKFIKTSEVKLKIVSPNPANEDVNLNKDKEISSLKQICKSSRSFISMRGHLRQDPIDFKALLSLLPTVVDTSTNSASTALDLSQEIVGINAEISNTPNIQQNHLRLKSSVSKLVCFPQKVASDMMSQTENSSPINQKRRRVSFAGFTIVNVIGDRHGHSRRARQREETDNKTGFHDKPVTGDISSDETKIKGILKKVSKSYCLFDNKPDDVEKCDNFTPAIAPKTGLYVKSSQSIIKGIIVKDGQIRSQLLINFISQQEGCSESIFSKESPVDLKKNKMQTLYCNEGGLSSDSRGSEANGESSDNNESPISGVESLYRGWSSPSEAQPEHQTGWADHLYSSP